MKLLVTGAQGFVSRHLIKKLKKENIEYISHVRSSLNKGDFVADISENVDWYPALLSVDVVVHCAARVHQMSESRSPDDVLAAYREVNTLGTLNLAKQAAQCGIKRFIYISSIKVNGENTVKGEPFKPTLASPPMDPYGLSKLEAEIGLEKIADETGMEVVVIRPPLIYGEGVKANFEAMMKLVSKGIPLPFGSIDNQRSLVYIDNLISLILTCCEHPDAANRTFLVSDNEDVSTTKLIQQIASSMGKPNRLIPVPQSVIALGAKVLGKSNLYDRLCGNLQLDISETLQLLSWKPPVTFEKGIQETVSAYLADRHINL